MLKLLNYQKTAVEQISTMRFCILADEPGLGKTIQAISVINIKKYNRVLILCPATLKTNWAIECEKWLDRNLNILVINNSKDTVTDDTNILIINYDLIHKKSIFDQVISRKYNLLICDEAHLLKNLKSKRTKSVLTMKQSIISVCKQHLMLTGTPFINNPVDIFPLLKVGMRGALFPYNNYYTFTKQFCGGHRDIHKHWICRGATNLDQLREMIAPYIIRRLKKDVLKDLPDKFYQQMYANSNTRVDYLIEKEKQVLKELEAMDSVNIRFSEISKIRKELGDLKSEFVLEHVINFLESTDEKLLIFAHHKSVISYIKENLGVYNVKTIDGETPVTERNNNVLEFQNNHQCRVMICNIVAGGVGITLTSAHVVMFAELPWTSAEVHQAVDRTHRIGQTQSVFVQFIVFKNSLDANMIDKIVSKEKMIEQLL